MGRTSRKGERNVSRNVRSSELVRPRSSSCPFDSFLSHSVDGKVYFETLPMRASFVRPDKVTVGDYPEIDPFAEDDDDDDDEEMEM